MRLLAWLIVLGAAVRFACIVAPELAQPFDLLRESPLLATVKVIQAGGNPYSASVYADIPFTLTMYAPLYFYAIAALPEPAGAPFLAGRLISLVAMLVAIALLFTAPRRAGPWLPALGASAFLLVGPVSEHAAIVRMDPLALAFSAAAVALVRRRTARAVTGASICALLAVATKQSTLAGALAGMLWLALCDRALALRFAAWFFGGLLLGLGAALLLWGPGFWFSTVVATMDPPQYANIPLAWGGMLRQPLFAVLVLLGAITVVARFRRVGVRGAFGSLELCYLFIAMSLATLTLVKNGSSYIYFLEPCFAAVLWLIASWEAPGEATAAFPRRARTLGFLALVLAAGLELATSPSHWSKICAASRDPSADGRFALSVRDRLRRDGHPDPAVLNLGPPRYGYRFADNVSLNDYYAYDLMWKTGRLSVEPLLEAIRGRRFDLVLLTSVVERDEPGDAWERLQQEIRANYRLRGTDLIYSYFER